MKPPTTILYPMSYLACSCTIMRNFNAESIGSSRVNTLAAIVWICRRCTSSWRFWFGWWGIRSGCIWFGWDSCNRRFAWCRPAVRCQWTPCYCQCTYDKSAKASLQIQKRLHVLSWLAVPKKQIWPQISSNLTTQLTLSLCVSILLTALTSSSIIHKNML